MFGDMKGMLEQMQQKMEESKKRLETITVTGEAGDGQVKVTVNGNRIIKDIKINPELLGGDKEELEELLVVALNRGLEEAEKVHEAEMKNSASGILPNIPGLF